MAKDKFPATAAIRVLKASGIPFTLHPYDYEEKGGTGKAAQELDVDEHQVIKTLVMENEKKAPVIVLMHGDRQVSTKAFARALKVKTIRPCEPKVAHKHTGFMVGGTSPLGTKKPLVTYYEATIAELPAIFINAGKRGLLARLSPVDLFNIIDAMPVNVAI
jgi:Cys-tRNA(Pro) deacylase